MSRFIPLVVTLIVFAGASNLSAQSSTLQPLNRPGTPIPESFKIPDYDHDRDNNIDLCDTAEDGNISGIRTVLKRENVVINSYTFWAIRCEKPTSNMTTQPNLLQTAILNKNYALVRDMSNTLHGLLVYGSWDLNTILVNEKGIEESILDWLNRQIVAIRPNSPMGKIYDGIRTDILEPPYSAKTIEQLRTQN